MLKEAAIWLEQAAHDLETAQVNLDNERYDASLLFSQQAAEKALKAVYLLKYLQLPPKTHNLRKLAELVGLLERIPFDMKPLEDFYFEVRYPDNAVGVPYKKCTLQAAQIGVSQAGEVVGVAKGIYEKFAAGSQS